MHKEMLQTYGFNNHKFSINCKYLKGAEANTSLLARLCWKYKIPVTVFYNRYLNIGAPVSRSFFDFEIASHFNSYTAKTITLEKKFNALVGGNRGEFHSYSFMNTILDGRARGFIHPNKRWCSYCYAARCEGLSDHVEVFDDLYWSVSYIRTCMFHGARLSDKCSQCFSKQPYISTTKRPGYCHHCENFLGRTNPLPVEDYELAEQRMRYQLFYISTFDGLRPDIGQFLNNLSALKAENPTQLSRDLGEVMGVSEDVVRKWISRKRKPQVLTLFQLKEALGLSGVHQLFLPEADFMAKVATGKNLAFNFNSRSKYEIVFKEEAIREYLESVIDMRSPPISRTEIAQKFEISVGLLVYHFKQECEHISIIRRQKIQQEKEERDMDVEIIFDRAFSMVRSRKKAWTLENVLNEIPSEKLHLFDDFSLGERVQLFLHAKLRFRERK